MRAKRYVKDIILECMDPEGCHARDLVNEVSRRAGEPFSVYRISSYLSKMFMNGEVRRERERASNGSKRYRWFKK